MLAANTVTMAMQSTTPPELCSTIYPFVLLSAYRILVCEVCGFACVANEAGTHLKSRHRSIKKEDRKRLVATIQNVPNILREQSDIAQLQYPLPTTEPIPQLAPPMSDGRRCRICGCIFRQIQQMQDHCTEKHHWCNPRSRGRPIKNCTVTSVELPWVDGVLCQRFFPSRAGSRWFEVGRNTFGSMKQHSSTRHPTPDPMSRLKNLGPRACSHLGDVLE
jgi:hypothetical protein